MKKILGLLSVLLVLASCSHQKQTYYASDVTKPVTDRFPASGASLEEWRNSGIKFVVRDENGLFERWGTLRLESWNDGDNTSEWVARNGDGQLVTGGYKGRLEKWKVKKGENERHRVVIRDAKKRFVTWVDMEDKFSAKWERWSGDGTTKVSVYVVRFNGQLVNWAKGHLENWANFEHPVLVVRDTEDDANNGKLLSWIAPEIVTIRGEDQIRYRNPADGRFMSANN